MSLSLNSIYVKILKILIITNPEDMLEYRLLIELNYFKYLVWKNACGVDSKDAIFVFKLVYACIWYWYVEYK